MSVALSPDGQTLAASTKSPESPVQLWRVSDGQPLGSYTGDQTHSANSVTFAPDGQSLAVATPVRTRRRLTNSLPHCS